MKFSEVSEVKKKFSTSQGFQGWADRPRIPEIAVWYDIAWEMKA